MTRKQSASPAPASMKDDRPALTERQSVFLAKVVGYWTLHGFGPSMRDIMDMMSFTSTNSVAGYVKSLVKKGYLLVGEDASRSLRTVELDRHIKSFKQ